MRSLAWRADAQALLFACACDGGVVGEIDLASASAMTPESESFELKPPVRLLEFVKPKPPKETPFSKSYVYALLCCESRVRTHPPYTHAPRPLLTGGDM